MLVQQDCMFDPEPIAAGDEVVPAHIAALRLPPDVIKKMDRDARTAFILERWPLARTDDRYLMLAYWAVFDRLHEMLGPEAWARFSTAFLTITHPETVRRGRQTIQKLETDAGHLLPDTGTIEYRRARAAAGPPRS